MSVCLNWNSKTTHTASTFLRCKLRLSRHLLVCSQPQPKSNPPDMAAAAHGQSLELPRPGHQGSQTHKCSPRPAQSEPSDSDRQLQMGSTSPGYAALASRTPHVPIYTTAECQEMSLCSLGTATSLSCTDRRTELSLCSPSLAVRCPSFTFSTKTLHKSMKTQIQEQSLNF